MLASCQTSGGDNQRTVAAARRGYFHQAAIRVRGSLMEGHADKAAASAASAATAGPCRTHQREPLIRVRVRASVRVRVRVGVRVGVRVRVWVSQPLPPRVPPPLERSG